MIFATAPLFTEVSFVLAVVQSFVHQSKIFSAAVYWENENSR